MARELWRHNLRVRRGRLVAVAWLGWVVGVVVGTQRAGLATAAVAVALFAGWQWISLYRSLHRLLPVGQEVTVFVSGDTLSIRDSDQVWLPRGSATRVERLGVVTIVFGRTVSTIVPTSALTDAHVAFLEGHGSLPEEPADPGPEVGRQCTVTPAELDLLVAARRRSYLRSGVFGLHVFSGLLVGGVGLTVAVGGHSTGFLSLLALPALSIWSVHHDLRRGTRSMADAHPMGSRLAVHVDDEGIRVSRALGTVETPWSEWQAVRVRPSTVELRLKPGQPLANLTLPSELFAPSDLDLVRTHVGREF